MKRAVKTTLQVIGAALAVVLLALGALYYATFGGLSQIVDGAAPASDVRIAKDGIVCLGVVDIGNGKVLLVDAGKDPTGKAIFTELARRHLGNEAVSAIFLTHGHADHTAGVHLFPHAEVYALAADIPLAEGREGSHGPLTHFFPPQANGTHVTHAVHDDETIAIGSKSVRVFAVPGHTAGSAAYLVSGVLFLGDSAGLKSDGTLTGAPWAFSDDSAQNHASLQALAQRLRPEQISILAIVPSHTAMSTIYPLIQYRPLRFVERLLARSQRRILLANSAAVRLATTLPDALGALRSTPPKAECASAALGDHQENLSDRSSLG
jgi:glyoxylase-like metal-dependent hydrolase (beta-lactamase superfamily II)